MPLRESEGPRRLVAWILALGVLGWSGPAAADRLVHYAIDAGTSVIHTAGGLDGTGIGDLAISHGLDITGVHYEPVLDGLVYDYAIVPEPSTLSLWAAALIVLAIPAAGIRGWTVRSPQA